ncbi:hypothetical protein EJ08DRAFT_663828 [Tothia fuscella]|uniref:Uncharacterized protein n=1 Tax=Tothia fuscella TaxID=1048955 RepID=A0A9P4TV53_9PEZI|nr:hypothetical protein EJ08DRAFT_663828 [Tothia fuscella]
MSLYIPNSLWTWSFLAISITQAGIALGLEGYVFANFQSHLRGAWREAGGSEVKTIPTYLSLLIFAFVYQLVLVYDALANKNTIQVIGLCIMNLGILVYTAIQIDQIKDATAALTTKNMIWPEFWPSVKSFLFASPCVIALGTVLLSYVAWKLYDEFAWSIYKQISADLRLKRRFLVYQIYIALLKFDFFLFIGFEVQFLVIVSNTTSTEFYLTIATLPATIILLLLAAWFTKRESKAGMGATIFVYLCALAYFIFKLVRIYSANAKRKGEYAPAARTLTVFAAIAIALLLLTIVIACWCTMNFNKGLKPHVNSKSSRNSSEGRHDKLYSMNDHPGYAGQGVDTHHGGGNRMEID